MFTYRPQTMPSTFFVVGGGGTGGRVIPLLAQFLRTITKDVSPRGWIPDPNIVVIDDDVVEDKNLQRQNFIASDVGKNKALVLAERYSRAFGVNIYPLQRRLTSDTNAFISDLKALMGPTAYPGSKDAMILLCVDSVKARRDILAMFSVFMKQEGAKPYFVVDAGNEDSFGQVKFFHLGLVYSDFPKEESAIPELKAPSFCPESIPLPFIPMNVEYYQNLTDNVGMGSCADLDQTLAINALMATMMIGVVQNYMNCKTFQFAGRSYNLDGSGYTDRLDFDFVKRQTFHTNVMQPMKNKDAQPVWATNKTFLSDVDITGPSAKSLLMKYIRTNEEKLRSMGLDPATCKPFEKVEAKVEAVEAVEAEVVPAVEVVPAPAELVVTPRT